MKYILLALALFASIQASAANLIAPTIYLEGDFIFRFQHDETADGYNIYQNDVYIDTVIGESLIVRPVAGNDYYIIGFDNSGNFSPRSNVISYAGLTTIPVIAPAEVCVTTTVTVGGVQQGLIRTHCY